MEPPKSIARGNPKLWANSKNILWVCWAFTSDPESWCNWGKVEAPHPKIGFLFINDKEDLKIRYLGEEA